MKSMIKTMKGRVMEFVDRWNPDAVGKAEHYIVALDNQLDVLKN
ncbi:MAG TPA: hypothetical protein PL032_13455 [Syntrophorhabdus sp.]|nr:hypothetical protein [Syntrophorhabdus sp.]HPL67419.1 hypothetical protein [Smithellaceae bacterium]